MTKAKIKAAKKRARRRAPVVYHGVVVRRPHVALDTPLPKLREAVRSAVRRYFDGYVAAGKLERARSVFVNCPFNSGYRPLLRAMYFTIQLCGYEPRCDLLHAFNQARLGLSALS